MAAIFDEDGVRFQYPENWNLERDEMDGGWSVTVQSPTTAFIMISFDSEMPPMEVMADTALAALKSEYEDLESESLYEQVAGQPAIGHNVRFFSLDLINTCWIRSFYSDAGTVLVIWQSNDFDLEKVQPVLNAIVASLKVEVE